MRIGIVTQPLFGNYGGILQNYALQQILKQLGHNPITLDFQLGYSGFPWLYMQSRRIIAKLTGRGGQWSVRHAATRSNFMIIRFIENHIKVSHQFWNKYTKKLIKQYNLDALIVGSDQVWRPSYNQNLSDSFLSFTKGYNLKRIAYAASFGSDKMEFSKSQIKMAQKFLKNFDAVSVRERSGLNLVKSLGSEALLVLDPTILLGRKGFDEIVISPTESGYLAYYILDDIENIKEEISKIQAIVNIEKSIGLTENMPNIGPSEWLGILRNSRIFLTDSFHGTVFCILFHIPFYTIVNEQRGADRFISLLRPLGLEDRLVESLNSINEVNTNINWKEIDDKVEDLRRESKRFLIQALG